MTLASLLLDAAVALAALCAAMAGAWAAQQRTGNSSWIDFGWTTSVALVAAASAILGGGEADPVRRFVVAALIAVWGARLGGHLLGRALRGVDDPRYADLARQWGADAPRRMSWFAQSQAVAGLPLVLSVLLAATTNPRPWPSWQDALGMGLVAGSIAGAGLADAQLRRFGSDPANRGKVCNTGLWSWSRHPNYFFEWLGWVGFACIALPVGSSFVAGWLALLAPFEMYLLLVYVSGLPPLEAHMAKSRPEAWAAYKAKTNAFFLWPPRR